MISDKQKGVSLIITFFIMIVILAVVLFVSILLYSEVKIIRNMSNSMVSFYAADSGIEKVLYYDRQVIPLLVGGENSAVRGFCSMLDTLGNPNACSEEPAGVGDSSIFCNDPKRVAKDSGGLGCDPDRCDNCEISFNTGFYNKASYYVIAKVYPSTDADSSVFEVESKGDFNGVARQVKILSNASQQEEAIIITNACAIPKSSPQGTIIDISVGVRATIPGDTIGQVIATINRLNPNPGAPQIQVDSLTLGPGNSLCLTTGQSCTWSGSWFTSTSTTARDYYVDIEARDTLCVPQSNPCVPRNTKKLISIPSYPTCITQ